MNSYLMFGNPFNRDWSDVYVVLSCRREVVIVADVNILFADVELYEKFERGRVLHLGIGSCLR